MTKTQANPAHTEGPKGRRVVITGYGAVTCVGNNANETWDSMRTAKSGIATIDPAVLEGFKDTWTSRIGGQVKDLDVAAYMEHREAKRLDRCTVLGVGAAAEAVAHAGIDFEAEDRSRCGVVIGSGVGGIATIEQTAHTLKARGPDRISPFTVPRLMANATAGNVSIRFGLKGPCSAHATACASSGHAIGDAVNYIRRGHADIMVTGGTEAAVTPLCLGAFMTMKALSTRNDDPARASRPFDKDRDGFLLAEGAGILVIESLEHALARGATIHAELVGYGNSADAYHITAPDEGGGGASRSMEWALADAGLDPTDIDYINAHGTSTPLGDAAEVTAVLGVFGDHARKSTGGKLLMSSTKGVHGHALGASGGVESIACIHAVRDGLIAPTANLDNPDDEFDIDLVANDAREQPVRYAMNNTFGFGGHNVTLILARYEG
ncbi:MAG: beta-ketoacyl-ACP synthase II [Planctomycetota bacterium]